MFHVGKQQYGHTRTFIVPTVDVPWAHLLGLRTEGIPAILHKRGVFYYISIGDREACLTHFGSAGNWPETAWSGPMVVSGWTRMNPTGPQRKKATGIAAAAAADGPGIRYTVESCSAGAHGERVWFMTIKAGLSLSGQTVVVIGGDCEEDKVAPLMRLLPGARSLKGGENPLEILDRLICLIK